MSYIGLHKSQENYCTFPLTTRLTRVKFPSLTRKGTTFMDKNDMEHLERMIDAYGLETVLYALGDICIEKAEHIRSNWQDERTAKYWGKRSIRITRTADAVR